MPCPPARVLSIDGRDGHMTAVTQHDGASSRAFLIVPLVSAFFLDLVNAVLSPTFIGKLRISWCTPCSEAFSEACGSSGFGAPANLQFQTGQPLVAAVVEMVALRNCGGMQLAGGICGAVVVCLMAETLAGDAGHQ